MQRLFPCRHREHKLVDSTGMVCRFAGDTSLLDLLPYGIWVERKSRRSVRERRLAGRKDLGLKNPDEVFSLSM